VEDSPNSAGVVIDSIRCTKLALQRGQGGVLLAPSAYFCKHPPNQFTDDVAFQMIENFIQGNEFVQVKDALPINEKLRPVTAPDLVSAQNINQN